VDLPGVPARCEDQVLVVLAGGNVGVQGRRGLGATQPSLAGDVGQLAAGRRSETKSASNHSDHQSEDQCQCQIKLALPGHVIPPRVSWVPASDTTNL
jgi:hypothetical protein